MSSTPAAAPGRGIDAQRYAYQAFISYSHAADGKLAASLQGALQRFAKPWYQRRALRVFRDTTGLTVTPSLWGAIRGALASSEYFILLASERAAQSRWVELELETWLTIASPDRLLIVWTDGELAWDHDAGDFDWSRTTCLHPRLRGVFAAEPLHLDLRWARTAEDLSPRRPEFLDAVARLSSTLRDLPFDDLVGEEIRQHKRTRRLAGSAIAGLSVLLIAATVAAVLAVNQRNEARHRLVEMTVASGARDIERGDLSAAALWFAQALGYETRRDELDLHRLRLRSALYLHPALLHVLTVDSTVQARWVEFSRDGAYILSDGFQAGDGPGAARAGGRLSGMTVWDAASGDSTALRITGADARHLLAVDAAAGTVRVVTRNAEGAVIHDGHSGAQLARLDQDGVVDASFGADGELLLTTASTQVRVWQAASARRLHTLEHDSELLGAFFTRDGARVVSSTADHRAHVWTLGDGTHTAIVHPEPVDLIDVTADGRFVITIANRDARLWQLSPGAEPEHLDSWSGVNHAEFSPDGSLLLLAGGSSEATLYGLDPLRLFHTARHESMIMHAGFSADGESFATAGADNVARVWSTSTGEPRTPPLYHEGLVTHVAFSPDRSRLATATAEGLLRIWDLRLAPTPIRHEYVRRTEFRADATQLLIVGDYDIALHDVPRDTARVLTPGTQLYYAEFSPDGSRVVTATEDGVARIWDAASGAELMQLPHERRVKYATFHPSRPWLLTAGAAGSSAETTVWDLDTGTRRFSLPVTDQRAEQAIFNADGTRVLTRGIGASLWDVARRERVPVDSLEDATQVVFSPDGRLLAALHGRGSVRAYDARRGAAVGPRLRHENFALEHVSFGADSRSVLITGGGYARLWDARTGAPLTPPLRNAPGSAVRSAVMSPDGRLIATLSADAGTVRLWDARNGQPLSGSLRHPDVAHAAFNAAATLLATTGSDVRLWPLADVDAPSDEVLGLSARLLAARRIDDTGGVVPLDAPRFRDEWKRLRTTRGH